MCCRALARLTRTSASGSDSVFQKNTKPFFFLLVPLPTFTKTALLHGSFCYFSLCLSLSHSHLWFLTGIWEPLCVSVDLLIWSESLASGAIISHNYFFKSLYVGLLGFGAVISANKISLLLSSLLLALYLDVVVKGKISPFLRTPLEIEVLSVFLAVVSVVFTSTNKPFLPLKTTAKIFIHC